MLHTVIWQSYAGAISFGDEESQGVNWAMSSCWILCVLLLLQGNVQGTSHCPLLVFGGC